MLSPPSLTLFTHSFPPQGLCSTAIDRIPQTRGATVSQLLRFFETDALCVRSDHPRLAAQQAAAWDPVLEWVHREMGVRPAVSDSIFGALQPSAAAITRIACV